MQQSTEEKTQLQRRQWLATILRWSTLSGLLALAAMLIRRGGTSAASHCPRTTPCRSCTQLTVCNLPPAERTKRIMDSA